MKLQPGRKVFSKDPVLCAESREPPRCLSMAEQKSHPCPFASVGPSRPHYLFFFLFQITLQTIDWSRVANKWGSKTGGFRRSIRLQLSLVMVVLVRLPELVCLLKKKFGDRHSHRRPRQTRFTHRAKMPHRSLVSL